jgi:dTDP-glucose pyrophosphorylase
VTVVTGYLGEMVESAVRGAGYPITVEFRHQARPDGTARAVALARDRLDGLPFFFGWGDIFVDPTNYAEVIDGAEGFDGTLAVNAVDDPWAGAAVEVASDRSVTRIVEKPPKGASRSRYNNAGFGVLPSSIWSDIDALDASQRGEYELPQAIAAFVARGGRLRAVPVTGPWWDIGTPADLAAARRYHRERPPA